METTVSPSGGRVERAVWLAEGFLSQRLKPGQDKHFEGGKEGDKCTKN